LVHGRAGSARQPSGFPLGGTSSPTETGKQLALRVCLFGEQSGHASRDIEGCVGSSVNLPLDLAAPAQSDHARRPGNNSAGSPTAAAGGQQTRTLTTARNVNFLPAIWSRRAAVYKAIKVSPMDQMGGVLCQGLRRSSGRRRNYAAARRWNCKRPRGFACCARHGAR
jgi:hypothetical protein